MKRFQHRLVQVSDLHFGDRPGDLLAAGIDTDVTFARVAERIGELAPDLVVATGDLAQDPTPSAYRRLAEAFARLPAPVHCLPGNHDDPDLLRRHLADPSTGWQRSLVLGDWQVLLLDSHHRQHPHQGLLGEGELAWLERVLAENPGHHSLVCLHHHPMPIESAWMDRIALLDGEAMLALLDGHAHVRGVLFGHVHQAFEAARGNLRLFGTPATSLQFRPRTEELEIDSLPPGLRVVDLHADGRLETRVEYLPLETLRQPEKLSA